MHIGVRKVIDALVIRNAPVYLILLANLTGVLLVRVHIVATVRWRKQPVMVTLPTGAILSLRQ